MTKMTEGSRKVFETLKANEGKKFTTAELAAEAGVIPATVTGSVNGLVKKGYAVREIAMMKDAEGKDKEVKLINITEAGMAFDPDAVVEA